MANKIFICLMLTLTISQLCSGSAIPMWEFLSRNEKMSHLYSIFAKLVSDYCKTSYEVRNFPVAQCKRDLLTYASDKLQQMPDNNLDILDPYQRGANDLIWNTIMSDHPNVRPTTKRPQYNIIQSGSLASSNQISDHNPTSSSSLSSDASIIVFGNNQVTGYQKNPIFDDIDNVSTSNDKQKNNSSLSSNFAMDMDAAYGNYHQSNKHESGAAIALPLTGPNHFSHSKKKPTIIQINDNQAYNHESLNGQNFLPTSVKPNALETATNYLSGPLVIRVRPDGSPVAEDVYKPLPRDDDRDFLYGNNQFIRRQKNFNPTPAENQMTTAEIMYYKQKEQEIRQQQQQQEQEQQILQQQYQRYQQRLRRQYRNSNSFRTVRRH